MERYYHCLINYKVWEGTMIKSLISRAVVGYYTDEEINKLGDIYAHFTVTYLGTYTTSPPNKKS